MKFIEKEVSHETIFCSVRSVARHAYQYILTNKSTTCTCNMDERFWSCWCQAICRSSPAQSCDLYMYCINLQIWQHWQDYLCEQNFDTGGRTLTNMRYTFMESVRIQTCVSVHTHEYAVHVYGVSKNSDIMCFGACTLDCVSISW